MAIDFEIGVRALQGLGLEAQRQQQMRYNDQIARQQQYTFNQGVQQDQARPQLIAQARQGNFQGAQDAALASGDSDLAKVIGGLRDDQLVEFQHQADVVGSLVPKLKQLPVEQRGQVGAQVLAQAGFTPQDIQAMDWSDDGLALKYQLSAAGKAEIAARAKAAEPYTLNAGDRRYVGGEMVAENPKPNNPDYIFDSESGSWLMKPGTGTGPANMQQPGYVQGGGGRASGGAGGGGSAPRSVRNNNPGNIEDGAFARSQPGYQGSDGRFAVFADPQAGAGAQAALLGSYMGRGFDTVAKIINRWAPQSDGNNTNGYVARVAQALGVDPNQKLDRAAIPALQQIISRVEGGPGPSSGVSAPQRQQAGQPGVINVRAPKARQGNAPSGYRFNGDSLEPIPGGPADPSTATSRNVQSNRKAEADLRKEFDALPEVKTFKTARQQYNTLRDIGLKKNPTAQDDIALVYSYMKTLDPTSVVREGEFATAQNAGGLADNIRNAYNKVLQGTRLNEQQRKAMVSTATKNYVNYRAAYNQAAENYRGYASDSRLSADRVARTYTPDAKPQQSRMGQFKVVKIVRGN